MSKTHLRWRYPVNPVLLEEALRDLATTWRMRDENGPADELEQTLNRFVPPDS